MKVVFVFFSFYRDKHHLGRKVGLGYISRTFDVCYHLFCVHLYEVLTKNKLFSAIKRR